MRQYCTVLYSNVAVGMQWVYDQAPEQRDAQGRPPASGAGAGVEYSTVSGITVDTPMYDIVLILCCTSLYCKRGEVLSGEGYCAVHSETSHILW